MTDTFYKDFPEPILALIAQGEEKARTQKWLDYASLGITHIHIPELIEILEKVDFFWGDEFKEGSEGYAPVHAWRALGQLKAEEAILPLINLILWDEIGDIDWVMDEIPVVLGMIGPVSITPIRERLLKFIDLEWAPVTLAHALQEVGKEHPESRELCISAIEEGLESYETNDEGVNAFLISFLEDLKSAKSASLVEKVFQAGKVDLSVGGDFEEFQVGVGLLEKRLTPRPRFNNFPFMLDAESEEEKKARQEKERRKREQKKKEKKKKKQAKKTRKRKKGKRK